MKKAPDNLLHPIDNVLYDWCEPISVAAKKLDFTPNDLTTVSLIFGLLAIVFLCRNNPILAVSCYFISFIFDNADGYYARKYKMTTKFGDIYDHVKDWVVNIAFFALLIYRNKHKLTNIQWGIVVVIFGGLLLMECIYFAALSKYQGNDDKSFCLGWLSKYVKTKEDAEKMLKWVKYFGASTFIVATIIFTLYIEHAK